MFAHVRQRIIASGHAAAHALHCRLPAATRPAAASLVAGTLADLVRSKPTLIAENALLRHQLVVLQRLVPHPLRSQKPVGVIQELYGPGSRRPNHRRNNTPIERADTGCRKDERWICITIHSILTKLPSSWSKLDEVGAMRSQSIMVDDKSEETRGKEQHMRYGRPAIISTIAVILVGVLSLGAGAPAYAAAGQARPRLAAAAPTVTVSPASDNPGAMVTVSGSGFAANETVTLAFDGNLTYSSKAQATAAGQLPETAFTIPPTSGPGAHAVVATGATSGRKATAGLTVTPAPSSAATLTVAPGATTRGGAVSVSGGGFTPNEAVELTIDGVSTPLTTLHADAAGALPATTITIPYAATVGAHTLTARGTTSAKTATAALTLNAVTATLTVVPASSTRGGAVTVSGGGFAAGESVTITIDGVSDPLAIARAGATGLLSPTSLTIPYTATVGAHTLTATGEVSGRKATAPLTLTAVVATVSLVPTTTNRGGLLTVSGANFAAGEAVTVTADSVITPLATITATAQGLLPPTGVSVPYALATGPHTLRLTGATSGRVATAAFTVAPLAPRIAVNPATASPGMVVTVSGSGFGRQERITLALNGAALPTSPPVITTTNGGFTASFTATQSLLSGVNTVGAIGNESRVSAISGLAGSLPVAGMLYFAGASTLPGETASLPILNTNAQRTHIILRGRQAIKVSIIRPFQVWIRRRIGTFIL